MWSPDSKKLAVYKVRPGHRRYVRYVESSPDDQLQPKHSTMQYTKAGDVLDQEQPIIFLVDARKQLLVDNALFPNAYDTSRMEWRQDSSAVTFEYNQRGHQVYRVIEVNSASGRARAVISEEPKTFFAYSGKRFRHDVGDGKEVIWMSERDGWNHLYLYDGATGNLGNPSQDEWLAGVLSAADFTNPAPMTAADQPRNAFRGPGFKNLDFSLVKNFRLPGVSTRDSTVQVRLEGFNALNWVNFFNPTASTNAASFGRVTGARGTTGGPRVIQLGVKWMF